MEGHSLCLVLGVGVPAEPWVAAGEPPPRLPEQAAAFQLCFAAWKCLRTAALRLYPHPGTCWGALGRPGRLPCYLQKQRPEEWGLFSWKVALFQSSASKERKALKSLYLQGDGNKEIHSLLSMILDWDKRRLLHQIVTCPFKKCI